MGRHMQAALHQIKKCTSTMFQILGGLMVCFGLASAEPVLERVKASGELKVCIWPDYYGISFRSPRTGVMQGIDIDLSAELAHELKAKVAYVDSSFATLIEDVTQERCDVAMFAIGMLPKRMKHLRFTRPYLQSSIYGLATKGNHVVRQWSDLDKPGVVVAVQAETFMEPVMADYLKHARLMVVRSPATRERELESGRADVFMTDYPYSRRLLDNADWAILISPPAPFHLLPYAYAVKPGDEAWFSYVDGFVSRIKQDGRLDAAAKRHGLTEIVVR